MSDTLFASTVCQPDIKKITCHACTTGRARGTVLYYTVLSLVPRPSASSAPCALRVIIKCGGGKTEAEGLEEFIT